MEKNSRDFHFLLELLLTDSTQHGCSVVKTSSTGYLILLVDEIIASINNDNKHKKKLSLTITS